jgi:hypothetical protein
MFGYALAEISIRRLIKKKRGAGKTRGLTGSATTTTFLSRSQKEKYRLNVL